MEAAPSRSVYYVGSWGHFKEVGDMWARSENYSVMLKIVVTECFRGLVFERVVSVGKLLLSVSWEASVGGAAVARFQSALSF